MSRGSPPVQAAHPRPREHRCRPSQTPAKPRRKRSQPHAVGVALLCITPVRLLAYSRPPCGASSRISVPTSVLPALSVNGSCSERFQTGRGSSAWPASARHSFGWLHPLHGAALLLRAIASEFLKRETPSLFASNRFRTASEASSLVSLPSPFWSSCLNRSARPPLVAGRGGSCAESEAGENGCQADDCSDGVLHGFSADCGLGVAGDLPDGRLPK